MTINDNDDWDCNDEDDDEEADDDTTADDDDDDEIYKDILAMLTID